MIFHVVVVAVVQRFKTIKLVADFIIIHLPPIPIGLVILITNCRFVQVTMFTTLGGSNFIYLHRGNYTSKYLLCQFMCRSQCKTLTFLLCTIHVSQSPTRTTTITTTTA